MRFDWRYPALALTLAAGEALGFATGEAAGAWPFAVAATVLAIAFGYGLSLRGWGFAATLLLGLAVGMSAESVRRATLDAAEFADGPFECVITADSVDGNSLRGECGGVRLKVAFSADAISAPPRVGERWRVSGWLQRRPRNDRRVRTLWVGGRGTFAALEAPAGRVRGTFAALKAEFSRRLGIGLSATPEIADLHRAILLGERGELTPALRRAFIDSGAIHLFAVSGLHVSTVAFALLVILACCGMPRRWLGLPLVPLCWAYVAMIGFPPSAVRAAVMATLYRLAPAFGRRSELVSAWSITFLGVHLVNPSALTDVGSLMSFAVMFAIALWSSAFRRGATFAAWSAGVPIAASVFGRFTPAGLLVNLLVLNVAVGIVSLALAGVLVSFLSTTLAEYVNNAAALLTRLMTAVVEFISEIPGASFEIDAWGPLEITAWYAVLGLGTWLYLSIRRHRLFAPWNGFS